MKNILAIETSCDETAVAVVIEGRVVSSIVHSQLDLHKKYGGVVPSIARLEHEKKIDDVIADAVSESCVSMEEIDLVAVTLGPGLAIALEVGIKKAVEIAYKYDLPVLPINHMEGHLFSPFINTDLEPEFPALGVLVSGGHTELIHVKGIGDYEPIGETLDDACGEAFDKAAVMLGLGYPGGPKISQRTAESRVGLEKMTENSSVKYRIKGTELALPVAMYHSGDFNLSYSGLKTALKRLINESVGTSDRKNIQETAATVDLPDEIVNDFCKLFEVTAIESLVHKLDKSLQKFNVKQVLAGGGVVANKYLRKRLSEICESNNTKLMISELAYTGDNAAMIGYAASLRLQKSNDDLVYKAQFAELDRQPRLSL